MTDLTTVSLTTPAAGFIFLQGRVSISLDSTTSSNYAFLQIDETQAGDTISGIYSKVGFSSFPSLGQYGFNCTAQRTYFLNAGAHTFRLEAKQAAVSGNAEARAAYPILTAMFFPTSYGAVAPVSDNPDDKPALNSSDR